MLPFWGSKARKDVEINKSALGNEMTGDIAVVLAGDKLDSNLVYLGCQMARGARRKVHLLHVIEVPRALALPAVLAKEFERADELLNAAIHLAVKIGCEAGACVIQARDAGCAIVDEARDHRCSLLLIGLVRSKKHILQDDLGKTIPYVLAHAPCKVWFVQDPQ
jgi:K+-sensing histidine kinase KdpD